LWGERAHRIHYYNTDEIGVQVYKKLILSFPGTAAAVSNSDINFAAAEIVSALLNESRTQEELECLLDKAGPEEACQSGITVQRRREHLYLEGKAHGWFQFSTSD
jgi:hypothetical protein